MLQDAANNLQAIEAIQNVTPNWKPFGAEEVVEGFVTGEGAVKLSADPPANMPDPPVVTPYDRENKADGADYYQRINSIKLKWDPDVKFWFNCIEASMKQALVFKQWTKHEVLQKLLPPKVMEEVRYLYRLDEDEAGALPYYDIKKAVIKLFAPKPEDSVDKALGRVLTVRPSHLAKQLMEDICKCKPVLKSQCCADVVVGLLRRQLPVAVRNAIADKPFTKDTYQEVLDLADSVFQSNKSEVAAVSVAAVEKPKDADPEVAAVGQSGRGRGNNSYRGNNNNRGGYNNRGGNNNNRGNFNNRGGRGQGGRGGNRNFPNQGTTNKGPRHSDSPPFTACQAHWSWGKSSTHCRQPFSCPWKEFIVPENN